MGRILIIGSEPSARRTLATGLRQDHHRVWEASDLEGARRSLEGSRFDALISDHHGADGEDLKVLRAAWESDQTLTIVLVTAGAGVEPALESAREGGFAILTRPIEMESVRAAARLACQHTRLVRENILLRNALHRMEGTSEIYGESPAMRQVRERIARTSPTQATILITGESGTGKKLVARAIHRNSTRSSKPFISVNCAAFTETLLENELFGYEKGSRGVERQPEGLFEAALEGTLFLDEVAELSLSTQAKLLRVLTDGQLLRAGSTRPHSIDVRVLASTRHNLEQRVKAGLFREDLFFRLAASPIHLPPLREHREDIAGLADIFCSQVATELKTTKRRLTADSLEILQEYDFPGNLRELRNLLERAHLLSRQAEIGPNDLPIARKIDSTTNGNGAAHIPGLQIPFADAFDLTGVLEKAEKELILRTLTSTHGAQAEAARRMGLSRSALAYKLTKYGIRPVEKQLRQTG
jgi:DNA-binding NtrC family response regulator